MIIAPAKPEEIVSVYGINAWIAYYDGRPVAVGGFRSDNERIWAFLDVFDDDLNPIALVRAVKRAIINGSKPVYVLCDERFATAPKLLTLLGFAPTDEIQNGMKVWKWAD